MSINVEQIGTNLMIQHYIGEITEKQHCRMVSNSDVYTPAGRTKIQVIWDLIVKPIDDQQCEYTNSVRGLATPEFLTFIDEHGVTFEQAAATEQGAAADHNRRETPLYAKSIERKALAAHSD